MSHVNPGFISTYNSLTDKHLAGYFSNIRIRRHLQRAGLITRSGRIVPDKEYRHKLIQRTHQRHVRECLAQAIFHKVLEMEHDHQIEIKRRLEEFARRERMHKIKVERSKRYEDDIIRILSPRPPTGARGLQKQHSGPEGEHSESSESPGSSRPNTAPGKMQRPVRLKPLHSNGTAASLRHSSPYRLLESSNENGQSVNSNMESQRRLTRLEAPHGISPYCLPVINNFVTPVPPATKRQEGGLKVTPGSILRGRRLRPATSSSGADVNEDPPMLRSSVYQSKVSVNMMYLGKTVHLSHDLYDRRDEVKVFQQHCGGENLCVYKGMLHEGETFRFISRRHRGFPFSLTFFLNGLQVERVSSCCEFKHRKGSRIGGRHGHFGFSSTDGASPCYKCIIAMGLDKKPTPPPKRVKEGGGRVESVISPKHVPEVKMERSGKEVASHLESEGSRPQDVETWVKEETAAEENQGRDDYEEDFEGDDEGPVEDVEAKENKYPSLSCESQSQIKERDDSETENDRDEYTKSRSASSSSGSDQDESDAADSEEDKKVETFKEVDQEEAVFQPDEMDKPNQENLPATEAESADVHNSARDSTEEDLSDTSAPSGDKNKQSDCTSEDKEVEKTVDESKQDEEQERAKSVQEKLAEAIMKESQCDSEPELSDTSTEEEESSANVAEQDSRDPVQESAVIRTEQQNLLEEKKCGESFNVKAKVVVQDGEQTSNPKEQEPRRNRDGAEDEVVKIDEEDGLAASEGNTADNTISEMTGLHPMCEEEMYEKTSVPQEDPAAKFNDNVKIEEENKEKAAVEADTQPHETEQRTNSGEEDESSVSESNQKTDERAVPNNAEESMMTASERTEMKAEPPEERVALSCEEASVADTQERQQGDREAEIEAENSSSSLEGSGDTTVEKRVESSEDSLKDERNTSDIKEEEVSAVGAGGKDEEETCDLGQEQQKECVEIDDKVGEKSENEDMGEGKHPNPDVLTDAAYREEHKVLDKESDSNTEEKADEQAEKTCSKDEGSAEEDADEETIREKEEGSKCVKNEKRKKEPEEKESEKDQTNEGDKTSVINSAADIEMAQEDHNEDRADQGEGAKNENDEESDETKYVLGEAAGGEGKPEVEKHVAGVLTDDTVKTSDEDFVESEVVGESDAANATHEGIVTEERVNDVMVAEDEREDTERDGENGDIDAENGEIFSRAENKIKDERGSQTGSANLVDKEENMEEEMKMKDVLPDKQKEEKDDQAPDTNVADSEVKEEDDIMEEKDKFTKNNSKPETTDPEIKEESKSHDGHDCEESKQDENGNISACERENTDLIKMSINTQRAVKEVQVASSGDKEESSTPTAGDLDSTASRLEESNRQNDAEIYPETNENFAAADGENGDPEEHSKASEETVSVLLQPQIQSPTLKEDSVAVSKETPDALETEDNIDLVKNWVTMHQASKFFETFVEPLDDLKESEAKASTPTESTKLPGLGSPQKVMEMAENVRVKEPFVSGSMEQEQTPKDVGVSKEKTKDTHVESDLESNPSVDNKDSLQAEEKTGLKDFMPEAKSEKNDVRSVKGQDSWPEEPKGSIRSLEEGEVNGSSVQDNPEHVTETEVESLAGTHRSVTSDRPENKTEEEATGPGPDLTAVKEMKDAAPSSERESCRELSPCAEGLSQSDKKEIKEETKENGQDLTVITDFTEEGSQDGSHDNETKPKSSEASISGERRDIRLIEDIQQTLSKGGLRKFSVDETLFGRSSYPLVIAARADSEN